MENNILIVDDEKDIRRSLSGILEDDGYNTFLAENDKSCFKIVKEQQVDLIILDIWLEGSKLNGMQILEEVHKNNPNLPIIMITGHGDVKTAIEAIKIGAYDFLEKPFDIDKLILTIKRAIELHSLKKENLALKEEQKIFEEGLFLGESSAVTNLLHEINTVAKTNARIFIKGQMGTGKGSIAKSIHNKSERKKKPFISINCSSMNDDLLAESLFGTEDEKGLLEQAEGGTLFLEEISNLSEEIQKKLFLFVTHNTFSRLNSSKQIQSDCRIISSSEKNMENLIDKGLFRQDLFYRLNVITVKAPSLNERLEDLKDLTTHFINAATKQSKLKEKKLSANALIALNDYEWTGNIRQLKNVCDAIIIMNSYSNKKIINSSMLPTYLTEKKSEQHKDDTDYKKDTLQKNLKDARNAFEKHYIKNQLKRFNWNISKTADFIGMERSALHKKMKSLNINLKRSK